MSALRKAGVWLGLVEEVDEPHPAGAFDDEFDDDYAPLAHPRSLARPASRTGERDLREVRAEREARQPHRSERDSRLGRDPRSDRGSERDPRLERELRSERELRADRGVERDSRFDGHERAGARIERATQPDEQADRPRQVGRPSSASSTVGYPTKDNLALAPQVQLRERAVVGEDRPKRYQITTLHPTVYRDARAIGEHFRDGHPVIMNLTDMDEPDAKRLVDFAAGLAFGLRGSMERVTNRVFLLSPPNIQVSAEDKARIAEGGFFNQG